MASEVILQHQIFRIFIMSTCLQISLPGACPPGNKVSLHMYPSTSIELRILHTNLIARGMQLEWPNNCQLAHVEGYSSGL